MLSGHPPRADLPQDAGHLEHHADLGRMLRRPLARSLADLRALGLVEGVERPGTALDVKGGRPDLSRSGPTRDSKTRRSEWASGGRHWTRTSDLLHVKYRHGCIVAPSVGTTQESGVLLRSIQTAANDRNPLPDSAGHAGGSWPRQGVTQSSAPPLPLGWSAWAGSRDRVATENSDNVGIRPPAS